jgi:hypothetical protein
MRRMRAPQVSIRCLVSSSTPDVVIKKRRVLIQNCYTWDGTKEQGALETFDVVLFYELV